MCTAMYSVREAAGQTVKSSISHVLVRDTRDDPFMASKGSYLRMKQVRLVLFASRLYLTDAAMNE
jgi:outer membrane protein assembly factor BamA